MIAIYCAILSAIPFINTNLLSYRFMYGLAYGMLLEQVCPDIQLEYFLLQLIIIQLFNPTVCLL